MKLSVETFALREKFNDRKAIELIAEAGFDSVDYSFYWMKDSWLEGDYLAYAQEIRQLLDSLHLTCNQGHAPFRLNWQEDFTMDNPHYREIVRAIESAAIMGARQIIVHALPTPLHDLSVDFEAVNLAFYRSLEPVCRRTGIRVAVENLFQPDDRCRTLRGVLGSPEQLSGFIEKLNSPWFVACIDVGHAAITGTEPQNFIRCMKSGLVQALHIQDTDYLGDRHTLPFAADLDWNAIMAALKDTGYQGDLTLEIFLFLRRIPDTLLPKALRYAADVGRYLISMAQ